MSAGLEIVTVALLTPVLLAPVGELAFPLIAVATESDVEVLVQGAQVFTDNNGLGLGIATLPVEPGRHDYIVRVEHGLVIQELLVTVVGVEQAPVPWWLFALPGTALVASVRIQRCENVA